MAYIHALQYLMITHLQYVLSEASDFLFLSNVKVRVKQSHFRPGVAQSVPGS